VQGDRRSAENFAALDRLLRAALELPESERNKFLVEACADDTATLEKLRRMLGYAVSPESVWESAVNNLANAPTQGGASRMAAQPPQQIGDWRVLSRLGSGGMAEVFLGERHRDGVAQRAAIKLMYALHARPELRARFERERHILASLSDARIARFYDGGVLDDGRPWLAMELVVGDRIDRWCDQRRLDLRARIELVCAVAGAVASAHRALIVHRDIKPGNVLISENGQVKLLDFGIAKLLNADDLDDTTPVTATEHRVLTPDYASPEQLLGHPITTGCDVYQLGVLLAELLTGRRPFERSGHTPLEFEQAIAQREAPRLSALARLGDDAVVRADARASTPGRLSAMLHGDLDAIAAKALATRPEDRYRSTDALIDDLQRASEGRSISAKREGALKRGWRFVRRNRSAFALLSIVLLISAVYAVNTVQQSRQLARESALNRKVLEFLTEVFRGANPTFAPGLGAGTSADELLQHGLIDARTRFASEPEVLATILTLGIDTRISLGDFAGSMPLAEELVALRRRTASDDPVDIVRALHKFGLTLHYNARYADAEQPLREALRLNTEFGRPSGPLLVEALADLMQSRGDLRAALALVEEFEQAPSPDTNRHSIPHLSLRRLHGALLRDLGDWLAAEPILRSVLQDAEAQFPPHHLDVVASRRELAMLLALRAQGAESLLMAQNTLDDLRHYYRSAHVSLGLTRRAIAAALDGAGRLDEAERQLTIAIEQDFASLAPDHILPGYARLDRAWVRMALGDTASANIDLDDAIARFKAARAEGHARLCEAMLARSVLRFRSHDAGGAREDGERAAQHCAQNFASATAMVRLAASWHRRIVAVEHQRHAIALEGDGLPLLRMQRALAAPGDDHSKPSANTASASE